MSSFSQAQLNDLLAGQLKDWSLDEGCLYREWRFTNWAKAAEAFETVSVLAEQADHHPKVCVEWGRLALWLKTHDGDFIGEKDLSLALQLNSSIA
jgi:4a-hydroxytetrahydrobiopterin dehydratase